VLNNNIIIYNRFVNIMGYEKPQGNIGENPENTAVRETKEESGYNVKFRCQIPKILSCKIFQIWNLELRI